MAEMITLHKDGKEAVCRKSGAHHGRLLEQGWTEEAAKPAAKRPASRPAETARKAKPEE